MASAVVQVASGAKAARPALDELLGALHKVDARAAQIVELRYFGGYEENEIAEMLGISYRTVRRDWRSARAFLLAEMGA